MPSVFDDVPDPAAQDFDLLPEAVRLMRRVGVSMHPELRAVWEPALLAALADKRPLYRAAAAHVLGRGGDAAARGRVVSLLNDADARVRFEAAAALARFGDKKAASVLVTLLDDGPFSLACQSEHLLRVLAEGQGPEISLDQNESALRRRCRTAPGCR